MRFTCFVTLSILATALGAPSAKRQEPLNGNVLFCTGKGFTGVCGRTPPASSNNCKSLDGPFDKNITSFRIEPKGSFVCLLWSNQNCQGSNIGGWIQNPGKFDRGSFFNNINSSLGSR
ncbi:unnamed protein product [Rhizoctonia solani]|uniref:Cyanovirin-N domain-containing protein n=1 Tax=Rhizoctonia solani TaxID=456999 RepID=A0A8H3H3X8_9AGAM|nr:unnamed protein product [Rhizoctonia solani]